MYYFGARYYDPEIGLWTSTDPAGQFWNSYAYAGNGINPINAIDPTGLSINDWDVTSDESIDLVTQATDKQWGGFEAYLDSKNDYKFADVYAAWKADGTIDYCGPANNPQLSALIPDQIEGADYGGFGGACHIHDIEYYYSGVSKHDADFHFLFNMIDAGGVFTPMIYLKFVDNFGGFNYKDTKSYKSDHHNGGASGKW